MYKYLIFLFNYKISKFCHKIVKNNILSLLAGN